MCLTLATSSAARCSSERLITTFSSIIGKGRVHISISARKKVAMIHGAHLVTHRKGTEEHREHEQRVKMLVAF